MPSVLSGTQALNNSELLARSRELQLVELAVGHYLRFADQCASQSDQRLRSAYCDSSEHRFPDELKHSLADGLSVGFLLWQYDKTRSACHLYSLALLSVCQLCQPSCLACEGHGRQWRLQVVNPMQLHDKHTCPCDHVIWLRKRVSYCL